jgi:molecular chaperone Hsp33
MFGAAPVRGEIVQLRDAWQQIIAHHHYPVPVLRLLGEMTAAAALLSATIKFNGTLIVQILGDGPVRLLVVECAPEFALRATAKLHADAVVAPDARLQALLNPGGSGRCVITLDPRERLPGQQPYQGVVPLAGETTASVFESYMMQSEQLDTRLWLQSDLDAAAGLLLQRLPVEGGAGGSSDEDAWQRARQLAATLRPGELLAHPPADIARRLFWQEQLQHYPPIAPRFACNCSRARISRMLLSLGRAEADSILAEQGHVEVSCDFCNRLYHFDAIDVAHLFAAGSLAASTGRAS